MNWHHLQNAKRFKCSNRQLFLSVEQTYSQLGNEDDGFQQKKNIKSTLNIDTRILHDSKLTANNGITKRWHTPPSNLIQPCQTTCPIHPNSIKDQKHTIACNITYLIDIILVMIICSTYRGQVSQDLNSGYGKQSKALHIDDIND